MKTKVKETFPSFSEMSGDTIDAKPRNMSWNGETYGEQWEFFAACECEKCGGLLVGTHGGEKHCDLDNETECDGYVESTGGPMMNYFYPLPGYRGDATEDAKNLRNLPVCIVKLSPPDDDDEWGLALTGGGMDLTWEIAEAHMRIGYMPPLHYCDLPEMCGRGNTSNNGKPGKISARDAWIIAGCKKSAQVAIKRARFTLHKLNSLKAQKGA